jgi:urease accessory protein
VETFLSAYLEEAGGLEAVFVRLSWEGGDLGALSEELSSRKLARESREASLKLGRRFAELVNGILERSLLETNLHYCIAFGAAGAAFGIPVDAVVLSYLNQSIAGLVSSCQRLMPLGQVAASRILWNLKPAIARAALSHEAAGSEEASCFSPYLELASMRHGSIETRLFIS